MLLKQIYDKKLSQYAYLIGCQATGEALLIDPERDIDRYLRIAEEEGVRITSVAETHIHADFLSGCREFAERIGVTVYLSAEGGEDWSYEWIDQDKQSGGTYDVELLEDRDTFSIGNIKLEALHTPGHTPEHLSYLITDAGGGADRPMGLVSGDFIFVNDVGRPDLLESAANVEGVMEPSARTMYQSIQNFLEMPDHLQIWPGHGAGSACGKALGSVPHSTAGYEKMFNPMIQAARNGEDTFVDEILKDQPEPQMYFARMKRDNKNGPSILGTLPEPRPLSVPELTKEVQKQEAIVIDTRYDRSAFMKRHLPGSLYSPADKFFNTVIGSLVVDDMQPIVLLVDEPDLEDCVRDLVRIGYDQIYGYADLDTLNRYFERGGPRESIEELTFDSAEPFYEEPGYDVLDVRLRSEFEEAHLPDALNASYTRLPEYLDQLPQDKTFLVHCATGRRGAAASSYLQWKGVEVKFINDRLQRYLES
jgi:hydroxyacylglutathione hydrolase